MDTSTVSVRDRARRAVQREIAAVGMRLFTDQGFEQTTADQIAAAAGISRRSFFRYFATKEDVLLGELIARGRLVAEELAARPETEAPWEALRAALLAAKNVLPPIEGELEVGRLLYTVPSLHAYHLEKQLAWREFLRPDVARRIRDQRGADAGAAERQAAAIVAAALSCLDTASEAWVLAGGSVPLEDLWDEAVAAVRE
jgi:AcrR family transcriptional regulator